MTKQLFLPNFLNVFEHKLVRMKKQIKAELDKPKKERKRVELKNLLKGAKHLQNSIDKAKKQSVKLCPHCGKEVE